jgi:hypothetical protein
MSGLPSCVTRLVCPGEGDSDDESDSSRAAELLSSERGSHGLSTAAFGQGAWPLTPVVVGRPMGVWRVNIPEEMFHR